MTAQFDLVVRNGTVLDGSGGEARDADVAIGDGRIACVGLVAGAGCEEIDAKGLTVTPGFAPRHYSITPPVQPRMARVSVMPRSPGTRTLADNSKRVGCPVGRSAGLLPPAIGQL